MRAFTLRKVAKGAGAIAVAVIALDLVATLATLAFGWSALRG